LTPTIIPQLKWVLVQKIEGKNKSNQRHKQRFGTHYYSTTEMGFSAKD